MSQSHPSRRWKGCCMMCAASIRGDGFAHRMKVSDLRRFGGKVRRIRRHETEDDS
jgi:hypothetical protein